MKRNELVKLLVKEGLSEKTLVNFTDKQLSMLSERLKVSAEKLKADPQLKAMTKDPNIDMEVVEKLVGKQKNIDKNKNGKIDAEDFELLKKNKSEKKEKLKEWIDKLVETNYHPVATKADIIETISKKVKESAIPMPAGKPKTGHNGTKEFMEYSKPETKPEKEEPDTETIPRPNPDEKPRERPKNPGHNPNPNVQPGPKAKDTSKEKSTKKKKDVKEITPEIAKKKVIGAIGKVLSK